ncbi:hypothetical protein VNO80_03661 [Phaseolus coccineus]|uniref:Uncharacterized protein n=1 Tax=Phaseolus coccineus TaxID=3886 RepID=A0AAN9NWG5_PHACN
MAFCEKFQVPTSSVLHCMSSDFHLFYLIKHPVNFCWVLSLSEFTVLTLLNSNHTSLIYATRMHNEWGRTKSGETTIQIFLGFSPNQLLPTFSNSVDSTESNVPKQ